MGRNEITIKHKKICHKPCNLDNFLLCLCDKINIYYISFYCSFFYRVNNERKGGELREVHDGSLLDVMSQRLM
jgi:hypothetical protein